MAQTLTELQKAEVSHQLLMGRLLSPGLAETMTRATLASAENGKPETNLPQFVAALYLEFGENLARHFAGDLEVFLKEVLPNHRRGDHGLIPEKSLHEAGESCDFGFGWKIKIGEDLGRILWNSSRLSSAVGKPASLLDFISALAIDPDACGTLRAAGLSSSRRDGRLL